jgi:hypothetical protein
MICSEFAPKLSNSKSLKLLSFAEQFEKTKSELQQEEKSRVKK